MVITDYFQLGLDFGPYINPLFYTFRWSRWDLIFGDFFMMPCTVSSFLKINVDNFFTDLLYYFPICFPICYFLGLIDCGSLLLLSTFISSRNVSPEFNYSEMMSRYRPRLNIYVDWSLLNFQHLKDILIHYFLPNILFFLRLLLHG